MRVLLVYPIFPQSFWSFEKTLDLVNRKALLPPLGLITVAAILPQEWEFKLVDRNVRAVTEAEWDWADLVILSAMIVQKKDFLDQIQEAKKRGKPVAVGGPYPTALPHEARTSGADYLVLDEGEITLPMLVEALERGETHGIFRAENGEKPDVTTTPIPRFELLEKEAYDMMALQFSRGCPFQCEFCDIIVLYGRKSRTKTPAQFLAELDRLVELGFTQGIFLVDDNFIGNKRNVKLLLREMKEWMAKNDYPFRMLTEASVDLAQDQELMDLMVEANFYSVFLGIETPDEASLELTKKYQNTRDSLVDSVDKITRAGLRVMAGFIIGFDGEKTGAGDRIIRFVETTSIPVAMFSMLQALPNTALWHRLNKEGRLIDPHESANINQTTLMNFVPTRPIEEIAREYVDGFWKLYDPQAFLDRTHRYYLKIGAPRNSKSTRKRLEWKTIRALSILLWRQGVVRKTRWTFWIYLFDIMRKNPGVVELYLIMCAHFEHFYDYRKVVRQQIEFQLAEFMKKRKSAPLKKVA
ncbi:B12-binding domain-containing radical SAM protein [Lyngbya sp. CCY1209]|uniref:B12-binding domain-containing radical SAM protein n=1 Tax=Lyngbya sp. CCY1209 TaxID=2886103 RepID=UPI002D2039E1|nr:B12-binding domain-containing radical SAM protein [Lyngbya sp. CCY1209]MEB3883441.1 B12-binding domain-containing radical SAM protein [Lyngbya sp. CCY1209]